MTRRYRAWPMLVGGLSLVCSHGANAQMAPMLRSCDQLVALAAGNNIGPNLSRLLGRPISGMSSGELTGLLNQIRATSTACQRVNRRFDNFSEFAVEQFLGVQIRAHQQVERDQTDTRNAAAATDAALAQLANIVKSAEQESDPWRRMKAIWMIIHEIDPHVGDSALYDGRMAVSVPPGVPITDQRRFFPELEASGTEALISFSNDRIADAMQIADPDQRLARLQQLEQAISENPFSHDQRITDLLRSMHKPKAEAASASTARLRALGADAARRHQAQIAALPFPKSLLDGTIILDATSGERPWLSVSGWIGLVLDKEGVKQVYDLTVHNAYDNSSLTGICFAFKSDRDSCFAFTQMGDQVRPTGYGQAAGYGQSGDLSKLSGPGVLAITDVLKKTIAPSDPQ